MTNPEEAGGSRHGSAPTGRPSVSPRWRVWACRGVLALGAAAVGVGVWFVSRYDAAGVMDVAVREFSTFEYPDDPAGRGVHHSQYNGRRLRLVQRDETHFDFVFEPTTPHVARVVFRNVDVSLMTPGLPAYPEIDDALRRVALTDREWNRQQVQFAVPADGVTVEGGDGWERDNLRVASLAKNCLNAGLWEVLLFTKTDSGKEMYYQGWFTFPMGHYKRLWERNTGLSYWDDFHFWRMEHWVDPAGSVIDLAKLREVVSEADAYASHDPTEAIWYAGEQTRKRRTALVEGVRSWGDYVERRDDIRFATFRPPGVYDVDLPWGNRYDLIAEFDGGVRRRVKSRLTGEELDELELRFTAVDGGETRVVIGGVDLAAVATLPKTAYHRGLYMPMGIGVPPFYQDYPDLRASPPDESPYYSFVLDGRDRWLDHHTMAIDGPVIHRDPADDGLLHVYLLSYERHQIVGHYQVRTAPPGGEAGESVNVAAGQPERRSNR